MFIIRIDCKDTSSAIKIFQILNDRGLDLSVADLIKSSLLQNINDKFREEIGKGCLKSEIDEFIANWRNVENNIKDTDLTMSDAFVLYEYYLLAQNPKKSLVDELNTIFKTYKNGDSNQIIKDFIEFCEIYKERIYNDDNKVINSLWYLRWIFYWKSIVLTAIKENFTSIDRLLILIRRFYYLYWIAGYTLNKIKYISFRMIEWIKDGKDIDYINSELNSKLSNDKVIEYVRNELSGDLYGNSWAKPLLVTIEYSLTDDSKEVFIRLDEVQIEHILPQKYNNSNDWKYISKEVADRWLNTGGNLTLLSGSKNSSAGNCGFGSKIDIYRGNTKKYNKNTGIVAFEMTRLIVTDFECNKYQGQWNEKSIQDRYDWFRDRVNEILDIDL
nr:HNH endonuclease family protein [uncultured Campylobacter sp.]